MNSRLPATYLNKAQQIAQDLLRQIADSNVVPGETFATEAELLGQFGVSRPTLREGIRILEAEGVLEQRPGPRGGLVIRRPSLDMLAHAVSIYLRFNNVPFVAVVRAREVIEPSLAAEAAEHGTEEDLRNLEESIKRMKGLGDDQEAFVAENRVFHGVIAKASGNEVLATFWGAISLLAQGEHHGLRYSIRNRKAVIEAHQRILDACQRRDRIAAAEAMTDHVGELEDLLRGRYQHLLESPMSVRDHRSVRTKGEGQ